MIREESVIVIVLLDILEREEKFNDPLSSLDVVLLSTAAYFPSLTPLLRAFSPDRCAFADRRISSFASFAISKRSTTSRIRLATKDQVHTFICWSSKVIGAAFNCSMVIRLDRRLMSNGCVRICLTGSNFSTRRNDDDVG